MLRVWDYSETSQTVSLLCRETGALRGLAKGAKRPRGSFGGGLELLTRGEISFISKPAVELATLTEWDLQEVFWGPRKDLASHRAALYLADACHHSVLDQDPHPALFDALVDALRALDDPRATDAVLAAFQWTLLSEMGYRPRVTGDELDHSSATMLYSATSGGLVAPESDHAPRAWKVRRDTVELLRKLDSSRRALPDDACSGVPAHTLHRAARLLSEHLRAVLDREIPTRESVFPAAGVQSAKQSANTL